MSFLSRLAEGLRNDMENYSRSRDNVYIDEGGAERGSYLAEAETVLRMTEAEDRIREEKDPQKKRKMQALYEAGIFDFDAIFDYMNHKPI